MGNFNFYCHYPGVRTGREVLYRKAGVRQLANEASQQDMTDCFASLASLLPKGWQAMTWK